MAKLNLNRSFHYAWLNLPRRQVYKNVEFYYQIGSDGGFFFDDLQCIVQIVRREKTCTVTIHNDGGVLVPLYGFYCFSTPILNTYRKSFQRSMPQQIRNRFPVLNELLEYSSDRRTLSFYDGYPDLGSSFSILEGEPIKKSGLTRSQMKLILSSVDYILKAEEEYSQYQSTKLYEAIRESYKKQKEKGNNIAITIALFKLIKLGFSLSSAGGMTGDDTFYNSEIPLDIMEKFANTQIDNTPEIIDYLLSPNTNIDSFLTDSNNEDVSSQVMDANEEPISFTGNGDKYSDNEYNQKAADNALAEEARLREKGDVRGAEAAHREAMKHISRIKK